MWASCHVELHEQPAHADSDTDFSNELQTHHRLGQVSDLVRARAGDDHPQGAPMALDWSTMINTPSVLSEFLERRSKLGLIGR